MHDPGKAGQAPSPDDPHHFQQDPDVAETDEDAEETTSQAPEDDQPHHFRDDPASLPGEADRDEE